MTDSASSGVRPTPEEVVPVGWMRDIHKAIFGAVDDNATYADVLHRIQWLAAQQTQRNAQFLASQQSSEVRPDAAREQTCETRGHLYGHEGVCIFCQLPRQVPWKENPPHGPVSERLMRHYYGASKAASTDQEPCSSCPCAQRDARLAAIVQEMRKYQKAPTGVIPAAFAGIWADQLAALGADEEGT